MTRLVRWFTILSLDAPLVAVAWQSLFADMAGVRLSWERRFILFAAVWLGYVADRWFDTRRTGATLAARHRWYGQRSIWFATLWFGILTGTLALSLATLKPAELVSGFVLVAATIAYTGFAQKCRGLKSYGHFKCLSIAVLLAVGAGLFALDWLALRTELLVGLLLCAALFLVNCLFIRHWEEDRSVSLRTLRALALWLVVVACVAAMVFKGSILPALATLLSLSALWGLHAFRARLDAEAIRSAADIALLSPFVLIPFL